MSDKKRTFLRADALDVARELCAILKPVTDQLIVGGSLRRRRQTVGDVEIVFVPKVVQRPIDLVSTAPVDLAEECINRLVTEGVLAKRTNVNGSTMWGMKNKLAVHVDLGMPVDFFATLPQCWFNYLVCRTGPAALNGEIAKRAIAKGWHWQPYGVGFRTTSGDIHVCDSERAVFEFVGLPYREPWERDAQ
jgi:DNA polymerase/3'-5' exonuclease PolX